jgi:hypothetical protein
VAGKIIADIIEAPYDSIRMNVANVTVLSANSTGITLSTATSSLALGNVTVSSNITTSNISVTGNLHATSIITANAGIRFPSVQVSSAEANVLDDYEEGTWTPEVRFGGNSVSVTYAGRNGYYTKIGNAVSISGWFYLSNKGSSTGDVTIGGLPFSAALSRVAICLGRFENFTFSVQVSARLDSGTAIDLVETSAAGVLTNITNSDFTNGSLLYLSGTYFV